MTPETPVEATPAPKAKRPRTPRKPRAQAPAAAEGTITLTKAQFDALMSRIDGITPAAAVAKSLDEPVSGHDLIGAMREVVEASKPPQKITVDNRVAYNPMNPTNAVRHDFRYPFFQNYDKVEVEDLLPREYELVPQLKPGLFIKSRRGIPLVEVILVKRGPQRGIHMRYENKGDKGKELQVYCRDMVEMMEKCIKEAAQQAERAAARRAQGLPEDEDDE